MHFYFSRHGETYDGNKLCGQRDVLLSPRGVQSMRGFAERCCGMDIGAVACSDLARTHEAALLLAQRLGVRVHVDAGLRECSLGSFETEETGIFYFSQRDPRELVDSAWNYDFGPYGGENNLHTHTADDAYWIVVHGEATFYGGDGDEVLATLGPGGTILIPRGVKYWFKKSGSEQAVVMRVWASLPNTKSERVEFAPPSETIKELLTAGGAGAES